MPSTDRRDKAEEQHTPITEKRIPLPVAVGLILAIFIGLCIAMYFTLSMFY